MFKYSEEERTQATAKLRKILKPGDKVYCILRHRSSSGMYRVIDLFVIRRSEVHCIGDTAAQAIGCGYDYRKEGIKVSGCGMDMGFHVIYRLGETLWPNGTKKPHGTRNGEPDSEGGYALKHSWL